MKLMQHGLLFSHRPIAIVLVLCACLVGLTLALSGCQSSHSSDQSALTTTSIIESNRSATVVLLSPLQTKNLIAENRDSPDFIILDIRTPDEFTAGHIANAVNIDFYQSDFASRLSELDRNRHYLVYCRTVNRSGKAVTLMADMGFTRVSQMNGGFNDWIQQGYPVEK